MRPQELIPKLLHDELLRLGKLDPNWITYQELENGKYAAQCHQDTWVRKLWKSGADAFGMKAVSRWLSDGPKVFRPTKEQCAALENVDVNLLLEDYAQPYPAILVELDCPPFHSVLCFLDEQKEGTWTKKTLSCCLYSKDHEHDIVTTVRRDELFIEEALRKFDEDCRVDAPIASKALRTACNSCLALTHYGCHLDYLFPKEVERDRHLAKDRSERGEKARDRIRLAVQTVSFDQEIKLHKSAKQDGESHPNGRAMPCHWRRGHWAMQAWGPGRTHRKRILRRPVLVRADLFVGDKSETMVTYQ